MNHYLYLLVNFFTILVPFIFSFHSKLRFDKQFRYFLPASVLTASLFLVWDIYFTSIGVWGFNPHYITGIKIVNLPLEEVLFFFCIPFSCVFTYHCFNRFFSISWPPRFTTGFVTMLATLLLIGGFMNIDRYYTSYTFISLGILLLAVTFLWNTSGLVKLLSIYPVLLIPFFIVNGILTGTGPDAPVVWYNDAENLGIRMLTIPFEDIFYGFELLLLNVLLYEYFQNKALSRQNK